MPSLRQIRRRTRSIQNTAKITRAMEMIAASKMRRAQARVLAGRPYAEKMQEVLAHLAAQPRPGEEEVHPLLQVREVKRIEVLHITPDRGLCGGLPSSLNRRSSQFILERQDGVTASVVCVGRKGRDFMVRYQQDVRAIFLNLSDRPTVADILSIAHLVMEDYTTGFADQVYLTYAQFVSTMVQRPVTVRLLPIEPAPLTTELQVGYIYEPQSFTVMAALLPRFVEMQIYHVLLEAIASEQSARMVAMRNATDNAKDMVDQLTLLMNKVRQDTITKELLDIVGGVAALER
ncbi:MAG: ATP synthase F1 subunit gamma [Dehalococcoidia bacterium]